MPNGTKFIAILALLVAAPVLMAGISEEWTVTLQSSGDDVSWTSSLPVRAGYATYFYECNCTGFSADFVEGYTDPDYIFSFDPSCGGIAEGVELDMVETVYDVNEINFDLAISIDSKGYAHAALTNVSFPEPTVDGYHVSQITLDFTISMRAIQTTWLDSFEYATESWLGETANWYTDGFEGRFYSGAYYTDRGLKVGGSYSGVAHAQDGWYGSFPDQFYGYTKCAVPEVDVFAGGSNADYVVRMDVSDGNTGDNIVWHLLGRYDDSGDDPNYVDLLVGSDGYSGLVAILSDTNGDGYKVLSDGGTYELAVVPITDAMVVGQPITLAMKFEGDKVIATVEHNGNKVYMSYTTSLSTGGVPGLGYDNIWGYTGGDFNDFEVYTLNAAEPQVCGDDGTVYLDADFNKDCQVDIQDLSVIAGNWLTSIQ